MSGAGNDFVVIDNRSRRVTDGAAFARYVCDRRWGIGADGLLFLEKSQRAHYAMKYFNADGSYGGMCGNGGRCIARFAVANNIAPSTHMFEALDFLYKAIVEEDVVKLAMKDPADLSLRMRVQVRGKKYLGHYVDTGSPHFVVPVGKVVAGGKALETLDVESVGRKLGHHADFRPEGTNVDFIEKNGASGVRMRTYERGVEAETHACGTGSIAAAVVASKLWGYQPPIDVVPRSGSVLRVDFQDRNGIISAVTLTGTAKVTFEGEIDEKP